MPQEQGDQNTPDIQNDGDRNNPANPETPPEDKGTGNDKNMNEADIARLVDEKLKPMKDNLDRAYSERDAFKAKFEKLQQELTEQNTDKLRKDGKLEETLKAQITALESELNAARSSVTELTRDTMVRDSLVGIDFQSPKTHKIAFREIVDSMTQDAEGKWLHKSGKPINEVLASMQADEDWNFLFKTPVKSGGGVGGQGEDSGDRQKKLSELTSEEVIKMAAEGKLPNF